MKRGFRFPIDLVAMDEALNQPIIFPRRQSRWTPTADAFARLLKWLDGGPANEDSQGQRYEEIRLRLVAFFERKECQSPEDLVDETFNRVMKWLVEHDKEYDQEPAKICYNTARFVWHESLRKPELAAENIDALPPGRHPVEDPQAIAALEGEAREKERQLACLQQCSQKLPTGDGDLIVDYYYGEQGAKIAHRKALAVARGVKDAVLRNQAYRIRERLKECVMRCLGAGI